MYILVKDKYVKQHINIENSFFKTTSNHNHNPQQNLANKSGTCFALLPVNKGVHMKVMETIDVVVKLKEKIEDAKATNSSLATQLQKLLDAILSNPQNKHSI